MVLNGCQHAPDFLTMREPTMATWTAVARHRYGFTAGTSSWPTDSAPAPNTVQPKPPGRRSPNALALFRHFARVLRPAHHPASPPCRISQSAEPLVTSRPIRCGAGRCILFAETEDRRNAAAGFPARRNQVPCPALHSRVPNAAMSLQPGVEPAAAAFEPAGRPRARLPRPRSCSGPSAQTRRVKEKKCATNAQRRLALPHAGLGFV